MKDMVGTRIQEARMKVGMTQEALAAKSGVSRVSISRYEAGLVEKPSTKALEKIANALGVATDYLLGRNSVTVVFPGAYPMPPQKLIPIYGMIKCGPGGLAMEELLGYAQSVLDPDTHFCLMCYGDSMAPKIEDGDTVTIHKQEDVETGEIAAVIVDGEEGTLKRVMKQENALTLIALNPQYPPRTFVGEDMNRVRIVGKAVKVERTL